MTASNGMICLDKTSFLIEICLLYDSAVAKIAIFMFLSSTIKIFNREFASLVCVDLKDGPFKPEYLV